MPRVLILFTGLLLVSGGAITYSAPGENKISYRFLSFTKHAPVPEGMGAFRSTWNSVGMDPDENIYVVWTDQKQSFSKNNNKTGNPYSDSALCKYDVKNDKIETIGSLVNVLKAEGNWHPNEFVEKGHTPLSYLDGKIYLGTMEFHSIEGRPNDPLEKQRDHCLQEMSKYRGSHLLAYDLKTKTISDVTKSCPGGVLFKNQGMIAMDPLPELNYLVCMSTPKGDLAFYNVKSGKVDKMVEGPKAELGRVIYREVIVTPKGKIYYGFSDVAGKRGRLYVYDLKTDQVKYVQDLPRNVLNGQVKSKDRKMIYVVTQNCEIISINSETDEVKHLGSFLSEEEKQRTAEPKTLGLIMSLDGKKLFAIPTRPVMINTLQEKEQQKADSEVKDHLKSYKAQSAFGVYEFDLATHQGAKIFDFSSDPKLQPYTTDYLTGSGLIDRKGRIYIARTGNVLRQGNGEVGLIQIDVSSRMDSAYLKP